MKLAPSTGVLAALLFLVVGLMIGVALTRTVDRWPLTEVSEEDWFFVEALDCKFPIPNAYTLHSGNPENLFFYYDSDRAGDTMTVQTTYPFNITITRIEGEYKRTYSDQFDLKYETLKQRDDLIYELLTWGGESGIYMIRNKSQMVRLMGGSREIADLMFDYCVAHPIEESNLECEQRDGRTWCSLKD